MFCCNLFQNHFASKVKSLVRSIIELRKGGITMNSLNGNLYFYCKLLRFYLNLAYNLAYFYLWTEVYKKLEGKEIPFRHCGYPSLLHLITSIPGISSCRRNSNQLLLTLKNNYQKPIGDMKNHRFGTKACRTVSIWSFLMLFLMLHFEQMKNFYFFV